MAIVDSLAVDDFFDVVSIRAQGPYRFGDVLDCASRGDQLVTGKEPEQSSTEHVLHESKP
jgi:hypothetical protein